MPHRLRALVALLVLIATPALAAPRDAVLNKAGVWGIDVDNGSCAASMTLKDGAIFLLRGTHGDIDLGLFARRKLPRGKVARIETEAYGFDFKPGYGESGETLYSEEPLNAATVAALRLAREVRLTVDGRPIEAMTFAATGFEEALDGLIACSQGEAGWWGKGVPPPEAKGAEAKGAEAKAAAAEPVFNKEGYWVIVADDTQPICTAAVKVDEGVAFVMIAGEGQYSFAVSISGQKHGRKGRLEADAYRFDFTPGYEGADYIYSQQNLDGPGVAALRGARTAKVSVDGRTLVDMTLEDTGHAQVLSDIDACSRGVKGWWGEGAKAR